MTASTRAGIPEEGHTPLSRFRRDPNRWKSVYDTKRNDDGAHATRKRPPLESQAFRLLIPINLPCAPFGCYSAIILCTFISSW